MTSQHGSPSMCNAATQHTSVVPNHGSFAARVAIFAVSQDTKVNTAVGSERDALDQRCRQCREQQQDECGEEQNGQRGGRTQHGGRRSAASRTAVGFRAASDRLSRLGDMRVRIESCRVENGRVCARDYGEKTGVEVAGAAADGRMRGWVLCETSDE